MKKKTPTLNKVTKKKKKKAASAKWNYFLPSTAIRKGSRVPATSKKELFVAIAYTESH